MNYAILDGTTVKQTGSIKTLFPNTSFPKSGPNSQFIADNNIVELVETLSYTSPSQKLSKVDAYVDSGKAYTVKVELTTSEEQTVLINNKWTEIRYERLDKLQETDWRASSDLILSDDWKTFRQALRDITTQSDPFNITWPTSPD